MSAIYLCTCPAGWFADNKSRALPHGTQKGCVRHHFDCDKLAEEEPPPEPKEPETLWQLLLKD